ncbi:hypothetical protein RF11_00398 [Thelohanellus kitauei]|uniref:WW domain-containing protein n=1 Tax=Thelohanellus kitauei TaxID=669202 RepID=A0A0C2MQP9_THEKT|nr:hypothetical protein RF11_00398 [Thelohanellus kitauei]
MSPTPDGEVVYIDHSTGTTHTRPPDPLPMGWEALTYQSTGRVIYHNVLTNQVVNFRPTPENMAQLQTANDSWAARRSRNRDRINRLYNSNSVDESVRLILE